VAHGGLFVQGIETRLAGLFDFMSPQFGFQPGEPLEQPIGANQRIDQEAFEPGGGHPILVIAGGHGFQFGGIFAGDDLGFGIDAGFERVEARNGLALLGARAGGELRIPAIRLDLTRAGHIIHRSQPTGAAPRFQRQLGGSPCP